MFMRQVRWLPDWREITSAGSVQIGAYGVAMVVAITTTLAVVDAVATRFALEGDRMIAALDHVDGAGRRPPRDDGSDPARAPTPVVDRRGYRIAATFEPAPALSRAAAIKANEPPLRISRRGSSTAASQPADPRYDWYSGDGDTYTTVCVRLCDGSIRPVSFSAADEKFDHDNRTCQTSCGSPARLYVYRNPGGSVADMTDLNGQPYARLKTAFLFQTTYVPNCTCRAQPWEQASTDCHRVYALQESAQRGDGKARAELRAMGAKVAVLTQPRLDAMVDTDGGSRSSFRSRRPSLPQPRFAGADLLAARKSTQVVTSSTFGWPGTTVMRLTAPSSNSSNYGQPSPRSTGSNSRESGWRAKTFEAR